MPIYFFIGQVFIPKTAYNGQNPIKLVRTKIPETTIKIIPKVPGIIPIKYNTPNVIAINILIILSAFPMFFFITQFFICYY